MEAPGLATSRRRSEEHTSELQSDKELDQALKQVSRRLGFDHFALSLELRSGSCEAPGLLLHDYPDEWAKVYVGFDLAGQDPVRRACDKSFVGFAWGSLGELIPLTRGDRQLAENAESVMATLFRDICPVLRAERVHLRSALTETCHTVALRSQKWSVRSH